MKRQRVLTDFRFSDGLFVKRFSLGLVLDVLNKIRGLLFIPLFARMLGADGYGTYGLVVAAGGMLAGLFSLDIGSACVVFTAHEQDVDTIRRNYYSTLYFSLGFSVLCCVVGIVVGALAPGYMLYAALALLTAYATIGRSLTVMVPQMFQHTRFVAAANLVSDYGGAAVSLALVAVGLGAAGAVAGLAAVNAVTAVVVFGVVVRSVGFTWSIDWGVVRRFLVFSLPLVPTTFASWVMDSVGRYVLWLFWGAALVGIYQVAWGAASIVLVLSAGLTFTYSYTAVKLWSSDRDSFYRLTEGTVKWISIAVVLMLAALLVGSELAVSILGGPGFEMAAAVVPLCGAGFCATVYNIVFASLVSLRRDTRYVMYAYAAGAAANIVLCMLLAPLGVLGVAAAQAAAWIVVSVLLLVRCAKLYELRFDARTYSKLLAIGALMFAFIVAAKNWVPLGALNMVGLGLAVLALYVMALLLTGVTSISEVRGLLRNLGGVKDG